MAYADVDLVPPGDFSYVKLGKQNYKKGRLLFYTWEQVETSDSMPMFTATISERDLLRLAKAALRIAGHPLAGEIEIPENTWGMEEK